MVEGKRERLLRRSLYQIRQCDPVKKFIDHIVQFLPYRMGGADPFSGAVVFAIIGAGYGSQGTFGEPEYFTQRIIFRCFCQAVAAATAPESGEKVILYQYL